MEKLSREEWLDAIHDVAVDAGNNYVKFVEQFDTPAEGLDEKVIGDIENFLKKKYTYEQVSNDDIEALKKFTPESVWKWEVHSKADGDEYDPRAKHEAAELAKYMPFLKGVAPEGKSWLDGRQDLKLIGSQMGFDYNREGMGKFLDKLRKYQTVYDRGQLMKEMRESGWYWPTKLAFPSLMEGIENAVSTGSDLTKGQAAALAGMDAGTNVAMFGLPGAGARVFKSSPILAGALDAGGQGLLELNRQYGKTDIDPTLEADPRQAMMASLFGATRPALVGTAQAAVSKIPTKAAMEYSRGIGRATRAGNPVAAEREGIMDLVKNHNRLLRENEKVSEKFLKMVKPEQRDNVKNIPIVSYNRDVAATEKMLGTKRVNEMADFLGVKPNDKGIYNVDLFMKAYDKKPVYTWLTKAGKGTDVITNKKKEYMLDDLFQLNKNNVDKYKALFPAKYADEAGASKIRGAGIKTGEVLGDLGGRFEPTFKINPLSVGPQTFPEYRKQDWYTRLGPKSRAIIDEAFKKKMEEDEEQFYLDVE